MPIDLNALMALADEIREEYPIHNVIAVLAMNDIPMSDAVIRLGVACGILEKGYQNGWSETV